MTHKNNFDNKTKESIYPDFDKNLPIIGIDLGTNYSCVGVWKDGKVNIIPNDMGQYKNPLYISFTDTDILFGDTAKNQISRNPKNTIFDIAKLIGKKYEDPEIKENIKYWPFEIIKDPNSDYFKIKVTYKQQEKNYTPTEILTLFLEKIKKNASDFLGQEIKNVIITIPVIPLYRPYIKSLKEACTASGLNALSFLNNTLAAAYAYGFNTINEKNERYVLIFDLGSSNLEISLNYMEDGYIEVKRRVGYSCLGGKEFDKRLVEYCKEKFKRKTGIDIGANEKALRRLFTYCEKAKKTLSTTNQATIEIDCLMEGQDLILDITRNKFEDICYDLFKKYLPCIEKLLKDADVNKNKINEIILVGGSSRIPKINKIIQDFFNGKIINKSLNPDECMAIGAVIKGEYIKNNEIIKDFIFLDKTNYSFGIETIEGTFTTIISRGMTIPIKKTMLFTNNNDNENKFLVKIFEGEKLLTKDNHLIGKIMFPISPMSSGQQQIEITLDLKLNLDLYITIFDRLAGKNYKIEICHDCQNIIEFGLNDKQENDRIGTLTLSIENKHSRINMNNMNYQNMGGNMNNMNYQNMGGNMNNMNYQNMGFNMNNMNYPNMGCSMNNMNYPNMGVNMNYQNMGGNMNNMNYQNMGGNMNNMNYQNVGGNKIYEDYSNLKNENENYKDRINQLEEEGKNKDKRILELEKELKDFKSYFLSEGEELISLSCISSDQTINDFKVIGKSSDKFTIIENKIFDLYPSFQDTNNYFLVNGKKINKYKTLKENDIKNNDTLFLYVDYDEDD